MFLITRFLLQVINQDILTRFGGFAYNPLLIHLKWNAHRYHILLTAKMQGFQHQLTRARLE